ncbi:hypothetical protein [Paraburkholderia tropica]|uniref:hypothetical protein n=1 Tax=Paraburkholderia tropica TaxID=92647 RepID=UPI0012E99378|nr:hypothetical protein [Paraburkholderia tropica]
MRKIFRRDVPVRPAHVGHRDQKLTESVSIGDTPDPRIRACNLINAAAELFKWEDFELRRP